MKPKIIALAAISGAAVIGAAQLGAQTPPTIQPGKWRSTTQFSSVSIPGLPPQVAGIVKKQFAKPQSFDYCLKPEDIGSGPDALGGKGAKNCKYEKWEYRGGRMSAIMVCTMKGQGTLRQVMDGTGSPTGYSANVDTTITGGKMGTMRMKGRVTGKRLGSC